MITSITRTELLYLLDVSNILLVEVSAGETFQRAHLPGAVQFAISELNNFVQSYPDREVPIILYTVDRDSADAERAAHFLDALGYQDLQVYSGGKDEWLSAGLPIVTFYSPQDAHELEVDHLTNVEKSRYLNNTSKSKLSARTDIGHKDVS